MIIKSLFHLLFISLIATTHAENLRSPHELPDDPTVALVLGGGGAKGVAHIGVLRALEEANIDIDIITGTSMGAIIGGFYASGLTVDEIENIIASGRWEKGFTDLSSRLSTPIELKRIEQQDLMPYEFGVTADGLALPQGLIEGQNILAVFREIIPNYWEYTNFDNMPIPFRAVATDVTNGSAVVLSSGDLTLALRASMSLPGIFAPVKIDNRLLIDGGIANNLPIDVAQDMGADVVIAVDVGSKARTESELTSFLSITSQLVTLMTVKTTEEQKLKLRAQDILVEPDMTGFSTLDFSDLEAIEASGYEAMLAFSDHFDAMKSNTQVIQPNIEVNTPIVTGISYNNSSDVSNFYLESKISQQAGTPLDRSKLEEDIQYLYALNLFNLISYDLIVTGNNEVELVIVTEQLPRNLSYLQMGLDLSSSIGRGDSNTFALSLFYRHDMLNKWGGNIEAFAKLGDEINFSIEYNQPFGTGATTFIEPYAIYDARDVYDRSEELNINEWWLRSNYLGIDLGWDIRRYLQLRVGVEHYSGSYDSEITVEQINSRDFNANGYTLQVVADTLDQFYFPRYGWLASAEARQYLESWGSDNTYEQYQIDVTNYQSFGRHTIGMGAHWESFEDAAPAAPYYTQLGGFMKLSGYSYNELSGSYGGVALIDYRYRLSREVQLPMSVALYAGATLEAGNVWQKSSDIAFDDLVIAGSLYMAVDSPLGPIYLAVGHSQTGENAVYLTFGQP